MNASLRKKNENNIAVSKKFREALTRSPRFVLPALAALGVGGHASALELGEIAVQSSLGEPLRASIAFALNPHEELQSYCIFLKAGRSASGLPSINQASVAVSGGAIRLRGETAINEPMLALQLTVDCPYAANLSRDYFVFLDPRMPQQLEAAAATAAPIVASPRREESPRTRPATARVPADRSPIPASTSYRVQRGDTLSGIAQRLSGRTVGIWDAVDLLFAANPDAFIDNNRNLLKAGALLRIPDSLHMADGSRIDSRTTEPENPATAAPVTGNTPAYTGYHSGAPQDDGGIAAASPAPAATATTRTPIAAPAPADSDSATLRESPATSAAGRETNALQPGDVAIGADGPFVSPIDAADGAGADASSFATPTQVIPETSIEVPAPTRRTESAGDKAPSGEGWSWLMWLGGSGVALILGLLLFGRAFRTRLGRGQEPLLDEVPQRRRRKTDVAIEDEPAHDADASVDFRFDDADAPARIIELDGDLDAGTGFQESGGLDVAQDFGFSTSSGIRLGLDVEFPDEGDTDLPTPARQPEALTLESEAPSSDEKTGEYDLSMIVDATRQPIGNGDETTKDLKAIELDADDAGGDDDVVMSPEVDYRILEQDYEDELTATQALNAELARAARELVEARDDATARLPESRDDTSLDVTVEMPAERDGGIGDLHDTNVSEELREIPPAENDATAEMDVEIETGTIDGKKLKVS